MSWIEAIILGIVQGLTEFLPISSSAHLFFVPQLFGWPDPGASFTAVIQLRNDGGRPALLWRDIVRIASAWIRSLWTPSLRGNTRCPNGLVHHPRHDSDCRLWTGVL